MTLHITFKDKSINMNMEKRKYLIVGGTSGITGKLVEKLKDEAELHLFSRKKPANLPEGVKHYEGDILNEAGDFPEIDSELHGLVYGPGTITLKPFRSLKEEHFLHDFKVNALGAAKVFQRYHTNLKKANKASVVFFSTVAVQTGLAFHASIASAKGAVEGLTRSLAAEFAPDVRVNAVAPSMTDTPLASNLLSNEKQVNAANERHPLRRFGQPNDIAEAVYFLLSEKSDWITGQVLPVDGGLSRLK